MKRWVIIYYTVKPRKPKVFEDLQLLLNEVVALIKSKAKFVVYEVGACLGDYS